MLVPSGFFVIETGKTDKNVIGYTLIGGGYGHGVGMSQNGAKALGEQGITYENILQAFFPEYDLSEIKSIQ
jgi:stage II sporulation protein D